MPEATQLEAKTLSCLRPRLCPADNANHPLSTYCAQAVLKVQTLGGGVCTHEALWKLPPVRIISELPMMSSIQS